MKKAYTLTELLVVATIVVVLMAILLPVISGVKKKATTTVCASNMRQIFLAAKLYEADNGVLPEGTAGPEIKPYYPTPLFCPDSKNKSRPWLRPGDYQFVGPVYPPSAQDAANLCLAKRGEETPLVFDSNHVPFTTRLDDLVSSYLVIRRSGAYDEVVASKLLTAPKPCTAPEPPEWFNY